MKLLLVGANGQLGHALAQRLTTLGEVKATTRDTLDLSQPALWPAQWQALCQDWTPEVIINAAAYTAVDKAQSEPELARTVNAQAPQALAQWARECGAMLVHFSTDYVFDGSGTQPWRETDATAPLSVYGQTKLEGEQKIAAACPRHLILRTSWVVGAHGGNFLKTMLRLAGERESLNVVADQVGVPSSVSLLCDVTVALIQALYKASDNDARWGIYHAASSGETHWCDYARYVIAGAIQRGQSLKAQPQDIHPITTAQYPLPAPRPLNSRLDTHKLTQLLGHALPDWHEGVDEILDELILRSRT